MSFRAKMTFNEWYASRHNVALMNAARFTSSELPSTANAQVETRQRKMNVQMVRLSVCGYYPFIMVNGDDGE